MAITKEAIAEIRDFHFDEERARPVAELGQIDSKTRLVYGIFPYQRRAVCIAGQPLVADWTEQPVLALVNGERFTPLAYTADIEAVEEGVIAKVADHIANLTRPFPEPVDGQEDY